MDSLTPMTEDDQAIENRMEDLFNSDEDDSDVCDKGQSFTDVTLQLNCGKKKTKSAKRAHEKVVLDYKPVNKNANTSVLDFSSVPGYKTIATNKKNDGCQSQRQQHRRSSTVYDGLLKDLKQSAGLVDLQTSV